MPRQIPPRSAHPPTLSFLVVRSISECLAQRDSLPHPVLRGSDEQSAALRFHVRTSPGTRSSRETCSWYRCAAAETEVSPDERLSAPAATSPRNLCQSNTALPGAQIPPQLRAGYKCSPLPRPAGDSAEATILALFCRADPALPSQAPKLPFPRFVSAPQRKWSKKQKPTGQRFW